jgi:hypothetical protein
LHPLFQMPLMGPGLREEKDDNENNMRIEIYMLVLNGMAMKVLTAIFFQIWYLRRKSVKEVNYENR